MWKPVVVAMAVLAIAGSSTVFAQQGNADHNGAMHFEHRHRQFSAEDRAAFVDARIAALKAGLELTPDQAKNWPTFEQALRDMARLRAQIRAARDAQEQNATPNTPFERMTQRADNLAKTSAALKRIADAGAPLYQTLDDAQKEHFKKLARILQPYHHRMHAWNDGVGCSGQGWRHGRG
jgi:zinc resistance-associated protein